MRVFVCVIIMYVMRDSVFGVYECMYECMYGCDYLLLYLFVYLLILY